MALQSKTFTWGSYAYKSESNAYVLELTLTENHVDQANNTSNISYSLALKSGSNNRFTGQIDSVIKLNDVQIAAGSKQITAAYNSSWTLLTGTANVSHDNDGSLNMPISVSIDTYNSYAPPDKTLSWSWALTDIPRASSISGASNVILGDACSVQWTPNSAAFRYKLKFSIGSWSYTTAAIHPNKTSAYTYDLYTLPIDVAEQITGGKTGQMSVVLTTYSDSNCSNSIGTDDDVFTVTVPENEDTKPTVEITLTALDAFNGLYLQGKTKVQATIKAYGQYEASIKSLTMKVDGKTYTSPWISNALTKVGEVKVIGTAVDDREIPGSVEQTITVLPYYRPRLMGVTAYRCTSDGIPADSGEYLKIEATRDYAPVVAEDGQHNFCQIAYRYKVESAESYGKETVILETDTAEDSVATKPMLDATFLNTTGYMVQVIARDTVGEETVATVAIPSERVFRHKRAGGKGLGLGGYCDEDDLLDVHWNQKVRKDLTVDGNSNVAGDIVAGGAVQAYNFGGIYMKRVRLTDGNQNITIKSKMDEISDVSTQRQSILLFGSDNGLPICGTMLLSGNGTGVWGGTETVTISSKGEGVFIAALPAPAWDFFVLISAEPFEIVN